MTTTITEHGYQKMAQSCLNAYGNMCAEFGAADDELIESAEVLYREHGPFDLEFPTYSMDIPNWYK